MPMRFQPYLHAHAVAAVRMIVSVALFISVYPPSKPARARECRPRRKARGTLSTGRQGSDTRANGATTGNMVRLPVRFAQKLNGRIGKWSLVGGWWYEDGEVATKGRVRHNQMLCCCLGLTE